MQESVFITLAIAFPLWAQLRRVNVSALYKMAALAYACIAFIYFYQAAHKPSLFGSLEISIYEASVLALYGDSMMGLTIIMLFFMGMVLAQERFGMMIFLRTTKVLFWVTHLAFLTFYLFPTFLFIRFLNSIPGTASAGKNGAISMEISAWIMRATYLTCGALVLLAVWSAIIKWRRQPRIRIR